VEIQIPGRNFGAWHPPSEMRLFAPNFSSPSASQRTLREAIRYMKVFRVKRMKIR